MIYSNRFIGLLFILASTCSEAFGQFAFKRGANRQLISANGSTVGPFGAIWANGRWIVLGLCGFIVDGLLWSAALYYLDITVAHPIGSIVFVVVAVFSKLFLREKISPRRWLGIAFILSGAVMVAFN